MSKASVPERMKRHDGGEGGDGGGLPPAERSVGTTYSELCVRVSKCLDVGEVL